MVAVSWVPHASISVMFILLAGCAKDQARDVASAKPITCEELFRVHISEAHPAIKWYGPAILSPRQFTHCLPKLGDSDVDTATIGVRDYLPGSKYRFLKECEEERSGKNVIYRVFEKTNKGCWFCPLDIDGQPYTNYIVVESTPREKKGVYAHRIHERKSSMEKIVSCKE